MFTVYVIRNSDTRKIYTGHTINLESRLSRHNGNNKKSSYTAKNSGKGKWYVVYSERFNTRQQAVSRERELKSFRGREFIKSKIRP